MELYMKTKRMSFSLHQDLLELIGKYSELWKLSKSTVITNCLECGFELMEKEKHDEELLNRKNRNFKATIPITVTIPLDIAEKLNEYSEWFKIKKSHLLAIAIHYRLVDKIDDISVTKD